MSAPQWDLVVGSAEAEFSAIAALDGNVVSFQREAAFALQIIRNSDLLQKCPPDSIKNAVINVASVGLTLSPVEKLAYLVPRDGKCCLDISYIGLLKIATDSGSIMGAKAVVVRKGDNFKYHGPFSEPTHEFDPFASDLDRGDIVGVYSLAKLPNGEFMVDTLNNEAIAKIRRASKAGTSDKGPWANWFEEMCKKSALKRGYKTWPRTERLSKADAILNAHEGIEIDITPQRQNGAAIAGAALQAPVSAEGEAFLVQLETDVRANGRAYYEALFPTMTRQQRAWLGREGHDRMWTLGIAADEQRGAS